jgi:hypothetical protein
MINARDKCHNRQIRVTRLQHVIWASILMSRHEAPSRVGCIARRAEAQNNKIKILKYSFVRNVTS